MLPGVDSTDGGLAGPVRVGDAEGVREAAAEVGHADRGEPFPGVGRQPAAVGPPLAHRVRLAARAGDHKGHKVQAKLNSVYVTTILLQNIFIIKSQ